jgi:hypothetical protein
MSRNSIQNSYRVWIGKECTLVMAKSKQEAKEICESSKLNFGNLAATKVERLSKKQGGTI